MVNFHRFHSLEVMARTCVGTCLTAIGTCLTAKNNDSKNKGEGIPLKARDIETERDIHIRHLDIRVRNFKR